MVPATSTMCLASSLMLLGIPKKGVKPESYLLKFQSLKDNMDVEDVD